LVFWAKVNNESVKSLKKVTSDDVTQTWTQSVDLSSLQNPPFDELNFTSTSIRVTTRAFGEMIAVAALSEPFSVKAGRDSVSSTVNTVYLFNPQIEDVYMSISVFEAATEARGFKETLRHEVATYKTDPAGVPVDLSDVGRDFARLVAKVGLSESGLEVIRESPLPRWARSEGLSAAQVAHICSATVCEGTLRPSE